MPRRLAVSLWGLVLAAAAIPAIATPVHAASKCTGWTSTVLPPQTIRVFRTEGPAAGKVQTVNFRTYVETTIAREWPGYWPRETLRAGAVAVKQYGWYWTMHYRGKTDRAGNCYDVVDYWADQVYQPEKYAPVAAQRAAVAATWLITLRKTTFFATGYWAGESVACGANADGIRMYQWSAYDCGRKGYAMEWILRRYYPKVKVVDPGHHNITGTYMGDGGTLIPGSTTTRTRPIAYTSTGSAFKRTATPELAFAPSAIIGRAAADVTGDGRDDLVLLTNDGTNDQSLRVLPATSTGYGTLTRWWLARDELSNASLRLVTGDFDADGRADAGLVAQNAGGYGSFYMMRSLGSAFATKVRLWYGALTVSRARAFGGDYSGDGRSDLLLEVDRGTAGITYHVGASRANGTGLWRLSTWLNGTELRRATTRTAPTDFNRDGRDDLVVAIPYGTSGIRLRGLVSTGRAFTRDDLWISTKTPWKAVKLAGGDTNGDGFGDVLLHRDLGTRGTRVRVMKSSGTAVGISFAYDDSTIVWSKTSPY